MRERVLVNLRLVLLMVKGDKKEEAGDGCEGKSVDLEVVVFAIVVWVIAVIKLLHKPRHNDDVTPTHGSRRDITKYTKVC